MTIELEIGTILEDYIQEVEEEVEKASKGVSSAMVNKLKKNSPTGKGMEHYKDGWKKKKVGKRGYVVFNEKKPGLTHLLNNGHLIANAHGEYERYEGDDHITKAADWATEEFEKRVKKAL